MSSANSSKNSCEILYRAVMHANRAMFTIDMQVRRIASQEPEDSKFPFRQIADFQFLIIAATRLRRAANLARRAPETETQIAEAMSQFNRLLPGLKDARDVAEHFDEYSIGKGKMKNIEPRGLEVFMLTNGGNTLTWLDKSISTQDVLIASEHLFRELKCAQKKVCEGQSTL